MRVLQNAQSAMLAETVQMPAVAVTVTFNKPIRVCSRSHTCVAAESAMKWFLHLLDNRCFKHAHRRSGYTVGSAVVVEGNGISKHVHCHLSLHKPPNITISVFKNMIIEVAKKVRIIGNVDVQLVRDSGWYLYMTKDRERIILWSLCREANPK